MENKNAPPEADAMARRVLGDAAAFWYPELETGRRVVLVEEVARAFTEYGDQRAHAAYMTAYREGLQRLADERKRASEAEKSADFWMRAQAETAAERDTARAAAIKEAELSLVGLTCSNRGEIELLELVKFRIRTLAHSLADDPPKSVCDHHWIGGNDGLWCTKCKVEKS